MKQIPLSKQAGFTVIELVLAAGLMTVLIVALVGLTNTSLTIWNRTERNRDLQEMGAAVMGLFAGDLGALEGGRGGDVLADWESFDLNRDNIEGIYYPRMRFVRQATGADLLRHSAAGLAAQGAQATTGDASGAQRALPDPRARALVEVCWALLPSASDEPEQRSLGVLWRGERRVDADSTSFLDSDFFSTNGKPAPGSLEYVTGGVLWFEPSFASQTSIIHSEWKLGRRLEDCATGWDAWSRSRGDQGLTDLNAPPSGVGLAGELPLFPRRVRIVLELERPKDLKFRTKLSEALDHESTEVRVRNSDKLPGQGLMILVDEEWMRVVDTGRGYALVQRGQRGTLPASHPSGVLVHYGLALERELLVPVSRENWNR